MPFHHHTLVHLARPATVARFGWEPPLGYWVEVRTGDRLVVEYDRTQTNYDHARPVRGLLGVLVEHEFFAAADVMLVPSALSEDLPEQIADPQVRAAAVVVSRLREMAD